MDATERGRAMAVASRVRQMEAARHRADDVTEWLELAGSALVGRRVRGVAGASAARAVLAPLAGAGVRLAVEAARGGGWELVVTGPGVGPEGVGVTERRVGVVDAPPSEGPGQGPWVRVDGRARGRVHVVLALRHVGEWVAPDELVLGWWGPVGVVRAATWGGEQYGWDVQGALPHGSGGLTRVLVSGRHDDGPWSMELCEDPWDMVLRYSDRCREGGASSRERRWDMAASLVETARWDLQVGRYLPGARRAQAEGA